MKLSPGLIKVVQKIANYWLARFSTWTTALQSKVGVLNFNYVNHQMGTNSEYNTDAETSGIHPSGGMVVSLRPPPRLWQRLLLLIVGIVKKGEAWGNLDRIVEGLRSGDAWRRWNRAMAAISLSSTWSLKMKDATLKGIKRIKLYFDEYTK